MFDVYLPPRGTVALLCAVTAVFFFNDNALFFLFCGMGVVTVVTNDN